MKLNSQLKCFLSLAFIVVSTACRIEFLRCTYKFPKNWHKTLIMENGWNETSIEAICKHRFELRYCTTSLNNVCNDRNYRMFAISLYERLTYLCEEGRQEFRDATSCLNDRAYQLQCKSCYAMGRYYHNKLSENERCALALRFVGCFRSAAENLCSKKARKFIEKYNWIAASYFVGCSRDWLSIGLSDQALTTRGYFKTVLTAFFLGYALQGLW